MADRKCGFGIVNSIKSNIDFFSPEQQNILKSVLSRPPLQTSVVSPSGFFRIHYDEAGTNHPSYSSGLSVEQNVTEVAEALDSVYRFEIDLLGFLWPPSDNGAGGDDKYDVYIQNQGGGLYGYTEWESNVGSINWTSFMVIDNDYIGYYSTGLDGMKVTVAHEFHHAIQVGNYAVQNGSSPYRQSDLFFYELTSTSMEEFVFDNVNDYYGYMGSYFSHPERAMPNQNGYNLAIWNIYIKDNFGFNLIKRQWEMIPSTTAIIAINQSLIEASTYFPRELNKFGIWTYFTNFRRIPGKYFEEAINYPLVIPKYVIQFPEPPPGMTSAPTANNFVKFNIDSTDTLIALVTNGDALAALQNPNQSFDFEYLLYADTINGTRKLSDKYSSTFSTSNLGYWSVSEILIDSLVSSDSVLVPIVGLNESFVFPNPYYYSGVNSNSDINIALNMQDGTSVDFNVYTSDLKQVYSSQTTVRALKNNSPGIIWNVNNNNKLGSGVYIYVIKSGDIVVKGKVVIFNE